MPATLLALALVLSAALVALTAFPKLLGSLLPSAASYGTAPDACTAVPPELLSSVFGDNPPGAPQARDDSTTNAQRTSCQWHPLTDQSHALGRYSYLTIEVATHQTSFGRPDFDRTDEEFHSLDTKNPTALHGIGDRAIAVHDENEVQVLATRANLTLSVRYDSVQMTPPHHKTPIPRDQLDGAAQLIAEQALATIGEPR